MKIKTKSKVSEPVGQKQLKEEKVGKPSFLMYFAATAALFGGLSTAVVLAYTSPAFLSMGEPDSSPSITDEEVKSWISSIAALGAAIGALVAGPMSSKYGRKMSLILNNCTFLVGWSCIILAEDESMIMIGRFITGFGAGYMSGCVPLYIVEITTTSVRGFFGAGFQLSNTIGQLLTNAVGTVVDWKTLAILSGIPALIMPIMMLFAPETPVYLMSKYGAKTKTATSLRRLRSDKHITTELEMLASMPREKPPMILSWQQLRQPIVYKPLFLSLGLFLFQQLSGITAITFYQAEIFAKSGSSLNPGTCAILTSAAQVVATLFSSLVVDKCGRKILLYISGLGHVCSLSALAYFFYMKDVPGFLEQNGWLALVSLVVFIVSYSVGFGPVPWMMGAEMTPYFASGFVNALAPSFNWTLGFLISKNFEAIQLLLSPAVAYAIFAFMSLLSIIFVKLFLPETSGKTSEEIERMFRKK